MRTQLICTFVRYGEIERVVREVGSTFDVVNGKVFLLKMPSNKHELILSYNVLLEEKKTFLRDSILVHRKKETNTIYTINALNTLILDLNNGVLDRKYPIDWSLYKDTILLKKQDGIRKIGIENAGVYEV